jgi:hypothetical protein
VWRFLRKASRWLRGLRRVGRIEPGVTFQSPTEDVTDDAIGDTFWIRDDDGEPLHEVVIVPAEIEEEVVTMYDHDEEYIDYTVVDIDGNIIDDYEW